MVENLETTIAEGQLPDRIGRLRELAYNLWWSWNVDARDLFRRLNYPLWRSTQHNPVLLLQDVPQESLIRAAADAAFVRRYEQVMLRYDAMRENGDLWFRSQYPQEESKTIAYFSFEFGIHSSLPIYSGGLGILSGDHAKEASDLGLPFVGVGFMYPQGYFRQRLPSHGWQEAVYQQLDMGQAPIRPVTGDNGAELRIAVELGDSAVSARIWRAQIGRVPLYLLDTDVDENEPWDRELSARLYHGDSDLRIRQEIMLGIGGVKTLHLLGIEPHAWHMNEGHSAFLTLECIREKVAAGKSFDDAAAAVKQQTVFTTHTPVPAGHDAFPFHMIDQYFSGYWGELGIDRDRFLALGWHEESWGPAFNMTALAMRLAGQRNAVSKLHGEISRQMWQSIWPEKPEEDIPIDAITNGIHVPTWIAGELHGLYAKYLGPEWVDYQDEPALWERLGDIPDEELWRVHTVLRRKLISYLRERVRVRWVGGGHDPTQVVASGTLLDPEALTIGFARRFATYKRANLIFADLERLQKIVLDSYRPVQIIFAGKAHPADEPGKALIQEIYNLAKHNRLGGRIAFVEDYDMHFARYLTQGVDVWLNTPRRPREASGTSGMKAAVNGVPNLSVLDGWWVEAYNGANGWAVNSDNTLSPEEQDDRDARALYTLLELEIVPLFYARDRDDIPRGWVEIMRESIRTCAPYFGTRRMVKQYTNELYMPAIRSKSK